MLEPGGLLEVVGEASYQREIDHVSGGRTENGAAQPLVMAQLVPEPRNKHDKFAVRVEVDGECVGYIPRGLNRQVFKVAVSLDKQRLPATCRAWLVGGWERDRGRGSFGVILDCADPPSPRSAETPFFPWLLPEALTRGRGRLALVGEQKFQAAILRLQESQAGGPVMAHLVEAKEAPYKTKIAGPYVVAKVGGETVGMLTAQTAPRYLPLLRDLAARGIAATCRVEAEQGDKKIEVLLWLCKHFASADGGWS